MDVPQPRLRWILDTTERGQVQTAYQVLVASSRAQLKANIGDVWDSGKVAEDWSAAVTYAGQPLASGQSYFWKVRVWDKQGRESTWSEPAYWTMGLLTPGDWQARWIGCDREEVTNGTNEFRRLPARYLRHEFTVSKKVQRAMAYVCGVGLFELQVNGRKVGVHVLDPALAEYDKRAFYVTFDVTEQLHRGPNALGVMLGNGRYFAPRVKVPTPTVTFGFPKLLLHLQVEYADGTREQIISDETWKLTTNGPIRANNEYDGEEYDAQLEMDGWSKAGFNDAGWEPVHIVSPAAPALSAQMNAPIQVLETIRPVSVAQPQPGVFIFDMGQNMVGWCRLNVKGPRGTRIRLRHAETLKPDGTLYLDNIRSAKVTDSYTLKGDGTETFEPRFTYHGFRYVEVTGWPGAPKLKSLTGRVVGDALPVAGAFSCSQPLLNQIYHNIFWGTRGNYRSIPTDCPQRDERQGWLGDRSAEARGESYLFDVAAFYSKWIGDIQDSQRASGSIPDVAPAYWPFYNDGVVWPSSFIIIPHTLYDQYGDLRILATHYGSMKKWADYMTGFLKDGIMPKNSYGDWCVPPDSQKEIHSSNPQKRTAGALVSTAYFFYDLKLLARSARLLEQPADAQHFEELAEQVKTAFNRHYLKPDAACYDNGTQTSCVLPLAFDMAPPECKARIFEHLVHKIADESHGHIGTGLVGGQFLMRVLADNGRPDLALTIAQQTAYPSWGYMISKGATTMWELWNGNTADPAMNSGNHVMLIGDLTTWLHEYLAGIRPDPLAPGFKKIIIKPMPVGDLTWVKAYHDSPYGLIVSHWQHDGKTFTLDVTIPANTTATIYVPTPSAAAVTENGRMLTKAEGVKFLYMEGAYAALAVESGHYRFRVK
jgi:alpha-L-rhamnosidase